MLDRDVLRAARLAGYGTVSTQLSLLSDHRLGEVVAAAAPLGSGIGGRSAELDVNGLRVFVKRLPLTDSELNHAPDTVTGETALPHPLQDCSSITVRSMTGGGSCTRTRPNPPGEEGGPGPAGEPPAREQHRGPAGSNASRGRRSGCR